MDQNLSHLRYLLAIYHIAQKSPEVSSVEIAKALHVSKPAVARMLKALMEEGLVVKKPYGHVYITGKGVYLAQICEAQAEQIRANFPDTGLDLTPEEVRRAAQAAVAALPRVRFFAQYESLLKTAAVLQE